VSRIGEVFSVSWLPSKGVIEKKRMIGVNLDPRLKKDVREKRTICLDKKSDSEISILI
jgi:hypothetical protein